jgi:hypothetical protein
MAEDRKGAGEVTERTASCRCGQLRAIVEGDPVRVSVCHCLACQKRTGSALSAQARWAQECFQVEGRSREWVRTADSGQQTTYHFCPECGSTVYYGGGNFPDLVAIPLGALDDPYFETIDYSVWERRKHGWVDILGESVEHLD